MLAALIIALSLDNVSGITLRVETPTAAIFIFWIVVGFYMDVFEFVMKWRGASKQ